MEAPMNRNWTARCLVPAAVLAVTSLLPAAAISQEPRPSQHGSVSQRSAGSVVTIEYNRPVARGRKLFGTLVPWGEIWNPGADAATNIAFSTSVQVNGQTLEAGTYS